jgi:DNA-binding SARP family transcriptional activator
MPDGPHGDDETEDAGAAEGDQQATSPGAGTLAVPGLAAPLVTLHLLRDGMIGVRVTGGTLAESKDDGLARQPRELLAYLALQRGRPVARDRILEALWPEKEPERSVNSFHQALRFLRTGLAGAQGMPPGGEIVREHRGEYTLAPGLFWVDALAFEAALDEAAVAERAEDTERHGGLLRRAVDLYGGDLLGDQVPEWVAGERQHLRERYLGALRALSRWHEARGDLAAALTLAIRLADAEPFAEAYHRRVMRLQARSGDREAMQRRYALLREILRGDLGTEPDERTRTLYERLMEQADQEQEGRQHSEAAS